jgi:SAM-dependent methyltransferase
METADRMPDTKALYDRRYADNYMDTDAYSTWGHGDLRTRQVYETLRAVDDCPRSVLDYGCGVGAWLGVLARTFPDARLHGVDISEVAIGKARQKYPGCQFESFDGMLVPFTDGQFDLVFSYHVLEHVDDVERSVKDIARLLESGGHAVIIFPCGNAGSFLDRMMNLVRESHLPADKNRKVLFFETTDGHVRRMTSTDTVELFRRNGLVVTDQFFSGQFFGTIDWLCRGTGPEYINRVFAGRPAKGPLAHVRLDVARRLFLGLHKLMRKKSLDITKKRNPMRQAAVLLTRKLAFTIDRVLDQLTAREWDHQKRNPSGTAQYLVFRKES